MTSTTTTNGTTASASTNGTPLGAPPLAELLLDQAVAGARARTPLRPQGLESVTLEAISMAPRKKDRGPTDTPATFETVELQTYLSDTEPDAVANAPLAGAAVGA